MATTTNYLRLKLPALGDPALIDVINDNFEILDATIGEGTTPTPLDLPSEPLSLSASAGEGRITLDWTEPTDVGTGILEYELQRSVGAGSFEASLPGVLTTDFQDTNLTNGTLYTYRVRARNADGSGPWSQSAAATPVAPAQAPDVPRNLAAAVSGSSATLTWSPPVGVQADSYTVERDGVEVDAGIQATSFTEANLAPGTYSYLVFGVNDVGTGPDSQPVVVTVVSVEILSYDAEVLADTPYLYAKLDEDSGTNFADASGNGRVGTLAGTGATLNVAGPLATADTGALQGAGAARVTFGDVADFAATAAFSIELNFKPTAVPNYSRLVSKEAYNSTPVPNENNGWGLQLKPDYTLQFVRYLTAAATYAEGGVLTPNVWNHLVATYDGTTMKTYLNAVEVASIASALSLTNHAQVLTLLAAVTSAGGNFNYATGVASRLALYSSALSLARIAAHHQALGGSGGGSGTPPPPSAPVQVTGLTATAGAGQATLAWNAATDATSYAVRWGTASGVYTNEIQGLTNTSYIVTGLTNGTPYYFVVEGENTVGRGPASAQASATPAATGTPTLTLQAQINATATSGTCAIQPGVYDAEDFGTASGAPVVINRAMTVTGGSNVQIFGSDIWTGWTGTGPWTSTLTVPSMPFNTGPNSVTTLPGAAWPEQVFVEDSTATDGWRELFQVDSSQTPGSGQFRIVNRSTDRRVQLGENPSGKRIRVTVKTMVFDVQASDVTIRGLSGPTSASPSAPRDGMKIRHAGPDYQRGMVNVRGSHARATFKWLDAGYSHGPAVAMYHTVAGGNADFNLQGNYLHNSAMGLDAGGEWNNGVNGNPAWGFVIEDNEIAYCNRIGGSGGWHYAGIKITLFGGKAGHAAVMRRNNIHHTMVGAPGVWLDSYVPGWTIGGATEADANLLHHNEGYGFRNEINDAENLGSDPMVVRWNKCWNNRAGIYIDVVKDVTVRDNVCAWNGAAWNGIQNGINSSVGIDIHWFNDRPDMVGVDVYPTSNDPALKYNGPFNNVVQDNKVIAVTGRFLVAWRQDNGGTMSDASNYGTGNQYAVTNASGAGAGGALQAENSSPRFQVPSYVYQTTLAAYAATKYGGLARTPDSYFADIASVQAYLTARGIPTTPNTT